MKQVSKGKRAVVPKVAEGAKLPGAPVDGSDPLLGFLLKFAEGWHHQGTMGVNASPTVPRAYALQSPGLAAQSSHSSGPLLAVTSYLQVNWLGACLS